MFVEALLSAILLLMSAIYLARMASVGGKRGLCRGRAIDRSLERRSSTADRPRRSPWRRLTVRQQSAVRLDAILYCVCELEGFEGIRRHIGYKAANALVNDLADRIRQGLPDCDVGRTNRTNVEFIWSQNCVGSADASLKALLSILPRSFELEGCSLDIRPRIAFQWVSRSMAREGALEMIDAALADPTKTQQDLICVPEETGALSDDRLYLLKELSAAITKDRLTVYYQPKLDCRSCRVTSVEALLRWNHLSLGAIGPDRVIAAAEETGLIRRLTIWVLQKVLQDLADLGAVGVAVPIYVNISGALLPDERFAADAVTMVGGNAASIGFEITETAVIRDPERAMANLALFRAAGISIAIDDYGSGLSSLAYLKQLPAQELKIDRLFVSGLTTEHRDPLLVRSSIDLAHALEMKVTAEGVDNPMALSLLTIMGCDMVQGYLISRPLPLDSLIAFLSRDSHVAHIEASAAPLFARPSAAASLTGI
jgi:EAL domain-containing protein (putative c-di-GMP-specific phosphodiesterase class I)